jgi:cell division protein ZapD
MSERVEYEQPLSERVRTFLRLEHLFCQTDYTLRGFSVWDSRSTLRSLIDILEILNRSDFKSDLILELDRQASKLAALQSAPGVDTRQLELVLTELDECEQTLHEVTGQIGQAIRDHELLASLRQRSSIPGGDCTIDLPTLHLWLQQEPEQRIGQLEKWNSELNIVRRPVALLLGMIREASNPVTRLATDGFYQQNLDSNTPVQLIRVAVDNTLPCFAEISVGKHRLTIRFLEPQQGRRPLQTQQSVEFELTCCTL